MLLLLEWKYIASSSSKTISFSSPWFNLSCSVAIRIRDPAHRAWKNSPSTLIQLPSPPGTLADILSVTRSVPLCKGCVTTSLLLPQVSLSGLKSKVSPATSVVLPFLHSSVPTTFVVPPVDETKSSSSSLFF